MKQSIKVLLVCLLLAITISCSISLQYCFPTSSFSTIANAVSELNQYSIYITKGESYQLKVKGAKGKVKWKTDDASIATVNSKGKVTAKKKGTALITVTTSSNIHFCYVHVETPKLSKTSIMLVKGTDYTLKVKGTNQKIKWTTSDKNVAKVSKYGTVYAKKAGTAIITATIGKKAYTCDVKVEAPVISKKDLILEPGAKFKLNLSGTIRKVKWYSSNKTVATISQNGEILTKEKGFSTITAKVASSSFECKLTVEKPRLSETKLLLSEEDTHYLFVYDTYQDESWSSSNPDVVEVDDTGIVDAKRTGTAIIHCNLGYKTLSCNVSVENPTLSQTELMMFEGDIASLVLNGTSQKIEWSSYNDSIASVSENGSVTANKAGSTTIYAKIGTKRFSCEVTVKEAPVDLSQIQATYYDTGKGIVGVFKNSYKEAVSIEMTVLYYNQNGNLIDQKSNDAFAIPTGKEAAIMVSQPSDGNTWERLEYSNYEVLLKVEKASHSNEELGNDFIKVEPTDTGNKIIVKATNTSDKNYSSIQIAILFFDANGKCIDYDYAYSDCHAPGSVAYTNFDYPYDRANYSSITPANYKVYVNHAYKYSWE